MKKFILLSILAMISIMGCSVTESENVKTSGIWAHYVIEEDETGTLTAFAVLRVGGATGTIIDLSGGEHMECNGDVMNEWIEPITNYHWSRVMPDADPERLYDFTFVRTDEEVTTQVELPYPPIIIDIQPALMAEGDGFTVTWDDSNPEDFVSIQFSGECIETATVYDVPDDGEYVFTDLVVNPSFIGTECELDVWVTREVEGDVNPAFQGGYTEARAISYDTVMYTLPAL